MRLVLLLACACAATPPSPLDGAPQIVLGTADGWDATTATLQRPRTTARSSINAR